MRFRATIGLAAWLLPAGVLLAQVTIQEMISPEMGKHRPLASYRNTFYFDSDVGKQAADMQWLDHDLRGLLPIKQSETEEFGVAGRLQALDFDTDAVLPGSRRAFPDHLWNIQAAPLYRRKLNNGWIAGGALALGSPSDRPFRSIEEVSVNGIGFVRVPTDGRNAWVFFMNYANDREYCREYPMAGFDYVYEPSDRLQVMAGLPYSSIRYKPIEQVQIEGSYALPRTVNAQITYIPRIWLRFYTGFTWQNDRFFLYDRQDDDDMLFHYEKRVRAGMFLAFSKHVFLDLSGGYAFDRFWFQGEDYDDRGTDRLNLADGPFVSVQVVARF